MQLGNSYTNYRGKYLSSVTNEPESTGQATLYYNYQQHFERLGIMPCDWNTAEQSPELYACKKPWLPKNKNSRILDFGCGWGHQLMSLWCAGFRNIEGVDISLGQIETARQSAAGRVQITCMDGKEYLKDKHESYDLIILYDVIEHISPTESLTLLKSIYHALVPGGQIVIQTPNMSSLLASYSRCIDVTHIIGFTEFSIQQLLDQAEFVDHHFVPEINKFWTFGSGIPIHSLLNRWLHQLLYRLRGQYPCPTLFERDIEIYSYKPEFDVAKKTG